MHFFEGWSRTGLGAASILFVGLLENSLILALFAHSARHGLGDPTKKLKQSKIIFNPSTPKARETLRRGQKRTFQQSRPRFFFSPGIDLSVVGVTVANLSVCVATLVLLVLSRGRMREGGLCDLQSFFISWFEPVVLAQSGLLAGMRYNFIVKQRETSLRSFGALMAIIWLLGAAFASLTSRLMVSVPGPSQIVCYPFGLSDNVSQHAFALLFLWTVRFWHDCSVWAAHVDACCSGAFYRLWEISGRSPLLHFLFARTLDPGFVPQNL